MLSRLLFAGREIRMLKPWINLALLAAESQQVIWLRCIKLSSGGAHACDEARLMASEKLAAAAQAAARIMLGGSPDRIVRDYRRKVRANVRRLSR